MGIPGRGYRMGIPDREYRMGIPGSIPVEDTHTASYSKLSYAEPSQHELPSRVQFLSFFFFFGRLYCFERFYSKIPLLYAFLPFFYGYLKEILILLSLPDSNIALGEESFLSS